jgi:thiamine-monophosphate kinase
MNEFELIERFFKRPTRDSVLGIGDDCALIEVTPGYELAISTDMLLEGRHFLPDVDPAALGHKALAVNLSDLAAMGARPVAFTLALSLPQADEAWLEAFSEGLLNLAEDHDCALIGGDTTKGPLSICITVFGEVGTGQSLRRAAAKVGDEIWVSGQLGAAALGLQALRGEIELAPQAMEQAVERLERPTPRVALGQALLGTAHAAIDLSDGLAGDLRHILHASGVGATVIVDRLPFSPLLRGQPEAERLRYALAGGDDYELCFTAPESARGAVLQLGDIFDVPLARVGSITAERGLRWVDREGRPVAASFNGFDHFA